MNSFLHIESLATVKWITALVFSLLVIPYAPGQSHNSDVEMYFEADTINVEKGSTFTNLLIIRNTTEEEITLKALSPNDQYPGLIFYPQNESLLGPNEEKRLPVKFIANLDFLKMESNIVSFTVSWSTRSGNREQDVEFFLSKTEDRTIGISPFSHENYIYPDQPQTTIMLVLNNRAYSPQSIKLEYRSVPEGLEFDPNQETVVVNGLERQVIPIRVRQRRQQSLFPEYRIEVKATELGSLEEKGRITIPVVVLTHQRQIIANTTGGSMDNFAEVAFNQYNTGQNYMYLRGNQEVPLSENLVGRLNLTADVYQQKGLYQLYDTWLELEHKNSILRAGNVYGSDYDYAISGRGAKFGTELGAGQEVEVLALENNYHLLGTYFPQAEGARMIGAKYRFDRPDTWNGKMSYLFDNDPRRSINTHVANFHSSANFNDRHQVRIEAGLSHEKGLMTQDQKPGFSAAVDYETRTERWGFQSRNSFASGSYAGLSRGSFNTTQRVDRNFSNNTGLYFAYQNMNIQPEYLPFQHNPELTPTDYSYQTQAIKTGYRFPVRNWNITLSPQYHKQMQTLNEATADFQAYRFQTNVSTSLGRHAIYWNTDYSYSLADRNAGWFHGLSSNLMYRYQGLSLHGAVQWNPNSVIDLNSYYYNNESFVNYSAYASYNFNALRRALTGTISAGAYYSELYENLNRTVSGNLEYKISPSWSLMGNFNYSHYESLESDGYTGHNYQVRIGVKKYFPVSTAIENHKVSFVLYEDRNFNGMLDIGEATLSNELVKLDHYVAITDGNGRVTFYNVPPGNYNLQVNEPSGSRLTIDPQITVDQNLNMEVGMVWNIRIMGKMQEIRQPYDDLETNVAGMKVYAKGDDGVIATTVVNHDHAFEFFLADGTYEIYVENSQFEFHEPIQHIIVDGSAPEKPIVFDYSKKDRKIEVKQF